MNPVRPLMTLYFLQTGMISLLVVARDGGAIETATIGREGAVGLHGALGKRFSFTRALQRPRGPRGKSEKTYAANARRRAGVKRVKAMVAELQKTLGMSAMSATEAAKAAGSARQIRKDLRGQCPQTRGRQACQGNGRRTAKAGERKTRQDN
jgi:hypothetical protein